MTKRLLDIFRDYLESEKRYSRHTSRNYLSDVCLFLSMSFPEVENPEVLTDTQIATSLTKDMLRSHIVCMMERGMNARTVNRHISSLSAFVKVAQRCGVVSGNPLEGIKRLRQPSRIPAFFTEDLMDDYLQGGAAGDMDRLIILLLYTTGIRRSELISLKCGDIDRSRKVMRVHGKGNKIREIPLTKEILEEIFLYLTKVGSMERDTPLFRTVAGKPLYPSYVNRVVDRELALEAGFTGKRSPHVLRHTIATHLLNQGADMNAIKEMLGHSSLASTQVYTHNTFEQLRKTYLTAHPRAKKGGNYGD